MRIAVDARPLAAPLTGIGRYTNSLLKHLTRTDHEWFLYSDRPLTTAVPSGNNITVRSGSAQGGSPGSLRWAQWEYVKWSKQDAIDTFWSPRHHLPLLLPDHIRKVVTIHDLVWKRYPETMQRKNYWLEKLLMGPSIKKADQVICVSSFTRQEVGRYFPTAAASKCYVIHEGAAQPEKIAELPPGKISSPYLLFVGTLEPRKNLSRLLQAYARKANQLPDLIIVGGQGWGELQLTELVDKLQLADRVKLLGFVSEADLHRLYQKAHCLLMPSLYEGFGLPALEAMQYEVPVLYSKETSLVEVVGEGGIGVDADSIESIANGLVDIEKHSNRTRLSAKAGMQALRFSWNIAAEQTLKVLTG